MADKGLWLDNPGKTTPGNHLWNQNKQCHPTHIVYCGRMISVKCVNSENTLPPLHH